MCRTGCPTQDHASWGECARDSNIQMENGVQRKKSKAWDGELARYKKAREVDKLSPPSTRSRDIDKAYRMADKGQF